MLDLVANLKTAEASVSRVAKNISIRIPSLYEFYRKANHDFKEKAPETLINGEHLVVRLTTKDY